VTAIESFWRAPRRLRLLLEDGAISPTAFAVLTYIGLSDGERDGLLTTKQALADLFEVSLSTIYRCLRQLEACELIEHDLASGQRRPFRLRLGPAALVDESADGAVENPDLGQTSVRPRSQQGGSVTEVTSVTTSITDRAVETRNPAQEQGLSPDPTSVTTSVPRARAWETEKETDSKAYAFVSPNTGHSLDLEDLRPDLEDLQRIAEGLQGTNEGTVRTLASFRERGLPPAAFHRAVESLQAARRRGQRIANEAGYVVAALQGMLDERSYPRSAMPEGASP
jgi:DNA-binding MarR family transcriptional regulator